MTGHFGRCARLHWTPRASACTEASLPCARDVGARWETKASVAIVARQSRLLRLLGASAVLVLLGGCVENASPTDAPSSSKPLKVPPSAVDSTRPGAVLPGHILFDRTLGGDVSNIYLYHAGRERQVTQPGGPAGSRVSPNHRLILVGPSDDAIPITGGTIDLNGQNYRRLELHDATLNLVPQAWSPDGSRIAFEGWDDT